MGKVKFIFSSILIFSLLAISSDAQVPPWQRISIFDLSGGLNDAYDDTNITLSEASSLENIVLTTGGAIVKREGIDDIDETAVCTGGDFTGGEFYKLADGTRYLTGIVNCSTGDVFVKMDYGAGTTGPDGTWDDVTGSITLSVGTDDQGDFAEALDTLVIEDGVATTAPFKWTGTGNADDLGGSPPEASMVEYHKLHLWLAGDSTNTSRVSFSALPSTPTFAELESFTATDFFEINTNDGQIVRGLKSGLDCLYIWKDFSIHRICGTDRDSFTQEQMVRGIGTCSNKSIAVINNQFLFTTCLGDIAVYDGGITVQIISSKIEGTLTGANQNRFDEIVAVPFDDGTGDRDYYVCLTDAGSSTHDLVLLFDTFHKAWTKFTGIACNAIWTYEIGTLEQAIAFGDYDGLSNRYPTGTSDNGTDIDAHYQSGQLRFDEIPQNKTFRIAEVFVNQESGSITISFQHRIDFESTGTTTSISLAGSGDVYDTATYDDAIWADLTTSIARIEINQIGRFLQWRVDDDSSNTGFTIKGLYLWIEPTGRI